MSSGFGFSFGDATNGYGGALLQDTSLLGPVKQGGKGAGIETGSQLGSWTAGAYPLGWWTGDRTADPGLPSAQQLDDMLRIDGKARSVEQALTLTLRGATGDWVPAKGDTGQAAWLAAELERMPDDMQVVLAQWAGATTYGRTLHELVFEVRDGRICPKHIAIRPTSNTRIVYDDQGRPQSLLQMPPLATEMVGIPPERSLIYLHNLYRDPVNGQSDLLPTFAAYMTKRRILGLWKLFLGRHAIPWTVAHGSTNDEDEAKAFARRVAGLLSGGVAGVTKGEDVTILNADGRAGQVFKEALAVCDQEMYASTLTQFLELGQTKVGSFALSKDHSDFFELGRTAMLQEIAVVKGTLARKLIEPNWGKSAPVPTWQFDSLAATDVAVAVTLLQGIATAPAPNSAITGAFLSELIVKVSQLLGLDTDVVGKEVTNAAKAAQTPASQIAAGAQAASRLVSAVLPGVAA